MASTASETCDDQPTSADKTRTNTSSTLIRSGRRTSDAGTTSCFYILNPISRNDPSLSSTTQDHRTSNRSGYRPTSKMSHDLRRRGSCNITIWILLLHFEQSYGSSRRDGEGRWLWRLVSPFFHSEQPFGAPPPSSPGQTHRSSIRFR